MGAIGGLLDLRGSRTDSDTIWSMSRSMLSRAACGRGAYLAGGVSLFAQDVFESVGQGGGQPAILTRDGHTYVAVLDGQVGVVGSGSRELYGVAAARLVLERYISFGMDFLSSLEGAFALAIWDGYRGELLLARDPLGKKPLFYASEQGRFAFSSQIKALHRFLRGAPSVDASRLRQYWFSPCDVCDGALLYRDIEALPAGYCGIFSGLGLTVYPYGARPSAESATASCRALVGALVCPTEDRLRHCLAESLFAFDYPRFDDLMPAFCELLDGCSCNGSVAVADPMLFRDIGYARERADRLGSLRGLWVELVPPDNDGGRAREQRKMDRMLRGMLEELSSPLLDRVFGSDWRQTVEEERTISRRIRMRGILYQTLLWEEQYAVMIE